MWEAEPIILCAPCLRGKDPSPFQSPVSAPCHSLMEVCPLQLNSLWWPHQFVVPAFGIVIMLSAPIITSSSRWCRWWWVSDLPGQKKRGNGPELSSQADLPAQCPGTAGRLPSSSPSSAPTSHREEAWREQLPKSPYCSQTCGSKGEQTFFNHHCELIEAFHGEFHGKHFIFLVSTGIWVLLHVNEVQGCRWCRHYFSLVGAHPIWL